MKKRNCEVERNDLKQKEMNSYGTLVASQSLSCKNDLNYFMLTTLSSVEGPLVVFEYKFFIAKICEDVHKHYYF